MRKITDHLINEFNANFVEVLAIDGAGPGGASHHYVVQVSKPDEQDNDVSVSVERIEIQFQNGPIKEAGVNGVTDEALFAVVIDRLKGFQQGKYACRENALALTHMQEAMNWLHFRTRERTRRGVEGTHQV